jgi:CysZ protein
MDRRPTGAMRELGRGAGAFLGGIGFVIRTPGVLGWALVPAAATVGIGIGLAGVGIWGALQISARVFHGPGAATAFGRVLFDLLFGGVALFGAVTLAVALAQPLTRIALDRIARPLDAAPGRSARARSLDAPSNLARSLVVAFSALGVTLPVLGALELFTLFAPEAALFTEPIAFGVSALGLAWELFDHPFSRRGLGVRARLRWVKRRFFAVLGFAAAAQVFLLIPGLDFFLLPVGIAGATRLFAESEDEDGEPPGPPARR